MKRMRPTLFLVGFGTLAASAQLPSTIRRAEQPMPSAKLASIPDFVLPDKYRDRVAHPLPAAVDNSKKKYMPPWRWEIQGLSCANAAAVAYTYTYASQAAKDLASSGTFPLYTYEYTYHFLNRGIDDGDAWMFVEAYDILKETGAPTSADFGGFEWGNAFTGWMSGYDKYYRAMKGRVDQYYKIDAKPLTADETIKQYLYDQGTGSAAGGLLVFQAGTWEEKIVSGKRVYFNMDGYGHSIPILGYDDNFLGGAYLVVDNFGSDPAWVAYKDFRAGGTIAKGGGAYMMFPRLKKDYSPKFTFKITMTHDQRGKIAILTGVANNPAAALPEKSKDYAGAFNYAGGSYPMAGKNRSQTLEFGLDLTDFAPSITGAQAGFFLQVISKGGTGRIDTVTLMDYSGATVKEYRGVEFGKVIAPNATTTLSIPWSGTATAIKAGPNSRAGSANPEGAKADMRDLLGRSPQVTGSALFRVKR